jgi:hypothetical protein
VPTPEVWVIPQFNLRHHRNVHWPTSTGRALAEVDGTVAVLRKLQS